MPRLAALLSAVLVAANPAAGQTLTLSDALALADRGAPANRIARGTREADAAQPVAALRGMLPTVRLEAGYLRTTDPLWTFGNTLRQRAIAAEDFAPDRLNFPAAVGNYTGGIVIDAPLINADAWIGRSAAADGAEASEAQTEWIRLSTRADVVKAYYGAILASERSATLESALAAARGHVRQAESMVRNGLATRSDALLAAVKSGELESQLAAARADAAHARRQLAVLLGRRPSEPMALPDELPPAHTVRAIAAPDTVDLPLNRRADLQAAESGMEAARADVQRARAAYLPRLNGYARYDWNASDQVFGGEHAWTAGVMASWTPFAGASAIADVRAARGRADAARARADAANAAAALELEQTRAEVAVSLHRLDIAERGGAQSAEAHRIVARKYAGELATVTELLEAQAVDARSALESSHARYAVIAALADRRQALGADPGGLTVLEAATATASHISNSEEPRE
jgi:outer membrane protein TolC